MNSKKTLLLSCAVSVLTLGQASAVNMLTNGGFEDPSIANNSYSIFSSIPGWTAFVGIGDGIEIQRHVAGTPQEGDQLVELDSNNNSGMYSDPFMTDPGEEYVLTFWYSDRPGVGASSNGIHGYAGDVPFVIAGGNGASDTVWTKYEIAFMGSAGGADDIEFYADGTSDSLGGYIDNVSVAPRGTVPEGGATVVLFGAVLGGLSMVRRRL